MQPSNASNNPNSTSSAAQKAASADQADTIIKSLAGNTNIELLLDVPMRASVELGATKLYIKDILSLIPGSVIELERLVGDSVDLLVNDRLIAHGEVVVVNDNFGLRITDLIKKESLTKDLE